MRLWVLSWAARGWEPRILLKDETPKGFLVSADTINFSQRPPKRNQGMCIANFGFPEWLTGALVSFPDAKTDEDILACGRPLDL